MYVYRLYLETIICDKVEKMPYLYRKLNVVISHIQISSKSCCCSNDLWDTAQFFLSGSTQTHAGTVVHDGPSWVLSTSDLIGLLLGPLIYVNNNISTTIFPNRPYQLARGKTIIPWSNLDIQTFLLIVAHSASTGPHNKHREADYTHKMTSSECRPHREEHPTNGDTPNLAKAEPLTV